MAMLTAYLYFNKMTIQVGNEEEGYTIMSMRMLWAKIVPLIRD
jgi:hypothetical protein